MRAVRTSYDEAAWGHGELWMAGGVVVAHEFRFLTPVSDTGLNTRGAASSADELTRAGPDSWIPRERADSSGGSIDADLEQVSLDANGCLTPGALVERFEQFLAGEDVALEQVPLDLGGSTAFQRAVTTTLRAVPRGEIVTYGELAALAGYPGAHRAVGTFCARNRFMFLVPCHRVVASDGIGSYGSSGVEAKRRLLALEDVVLC